MTRRGTLTARGRRSRLAPFLTAALLAGAAGACLAQAGVQRAPDSPATAAAVPARVWVLRVPSVEKVVFRGAVSHDAAGMGTGSMMYPAPNAIGLLAAIVTHGLVSDRMRQNQKNEAQANADLVLQPFAPVLGSFTNQHLFEVGQQRLSAAHPARLLGAAETPGTDWLVEAAPVFSMTQDRRALVLDNAVRIFAPGSTTVAYAQTVRVISAPLSLPAPAPVAGTASEPTQVADDGTVALWMATQGQRLVDESAALFGESLDIVLDESVAPATENKSPHQTFRYAEGGNERMERAQLVSERCGRRLIRTLRGWLMSVPAGSDASGEACAARATPPSQ